ncbi:hypothetical protein pb186bvf_006495 [Paramecium bursaria]
MSLKLEKQAVEQLLSIPDDSIHDYYAIEIPKPLVRIQKISQTLPFLTDRCRTEQKSRSLYRPALMKQIPQLSESPLLPNKKSLRFKSPMKANIVKLSQPISILSLTERINPVLIRRKTIDYQPRYKISNRFK